ncbi:MAG TPA: gephyrin-like molybdotransferase Glp [Terriglobales bacterium]|nr:gephyrin-like molybdotransferase Glp [Terriglobales bacterium]
MPVHTQPAILAFPDARRVVEEQACTLRPGRTELTALLRSRGRVLAEDIAADRDFPPFPRAARDGYAVRSADLAALPAALKVIGEVRAGSVLSGGPLGPGEAAEIMTGAPVPEGADAVVMVEYTTRQDANVTVERAAGPGENVAPTGSEARAGQLLLPRGTRMGFAEIAVAAGVGRAQVHIYGPPRVGILSTGDEIVDVEAHPGPSQIRNSNSYSLSAQVEAAGAEPVRLPIAVDDPVVLRHLIEEGLALDLLLLTGGVSMGKYDLVEPVLAEFGAEFFFTGAQIQPGRPVVFGRARRSPGAETATYFFGLPGNPVSTMVTFEIFVRPILDALCGASPRKLRFLQARLGTEIRTKTGLTRFLPARLSGEFERTEVELVRWQGSGDTAAMARADCFLVVPPDRERLAAGEMVSVLLR